VSLPSAGEVHDAGRAATALLRCALAEDEDGIEAILATADLKHVASLLAGQLLQALREYAVAVGVPEDQADEMVDRQLLAFLHAPDA